MKVILNKIDRELEELHNRMLVNTRLPANKRILSTVFKVFRADLKRMEATGWIKEGCPDMKVE